MHVAAELGHRRIGAANAAWCYEARLQVHADNGCLRSHQVAQVDRSNRLNDSRLPKQAMAAHSKLVDNANPDTTLLGLYFQQPARRVTISTSSGSSRLISLASSARTVLAPDTFSLNTL